MPSLDNLLKILALLGITTIPIVVLTIIFINLYPKFKTVISDIIKFFSFLGKKAKKISLELEVEGTINSTIKQLNDENSTDIFPECVVKWVNPDNVQNILSDGKAIVRLDFSKKGNDETFYNCVYQYNKAALLYRTKPYMHNYTAEAIDLLMTKIMLLSSKRHAITFFNTSFLEKEHNIKESFYKLEDTYDKGMFQKMLIHELFLLGEKITTKAPREEHKLEIENFINWFHDIATREKEEKSLLYFCKENIKIGIILIAKDDTVNKYGIEPYIRRARYYATNEYDGIYLMSRGRNRGTIVEKIAEQLISTGEFSRLIKNPHLIRYDKKINEKIFITCYPLKSQYLNVIQNAWDYIEESFNEGALIKGIVTTIKHDSIITSINGLSVIIESEELSLMPKIIPDCYFNIGDELELKIIECNREKQTLTLSNKKMKTDPHSIVEQYQKYINNTLNAKVIKIIKYKGLENGIIVSLPKLGTVNGYIPRKNATYSKYISLSEKYKQTLDLDIAIEKFDYSRNQFICKIINLTDPWEQINKYKINEITKGIVREISERVIKIELEEGIEGIVYPEEYDWKNSINDCLNRLQISEKIQIKILNIEKEKRRIILSLKKVKVSQEFRFYKNNIGKRITFNVTEINHYFIIGNLDGLRIYLHISEFDWLFIDNIKNHISIDDNLDAKVINYDEKYNSVIVSKKRLEANEYEYFKKKGIKQIKGRVNKVVNNFALINLKYEGTEVKGSIHISEISNFFRIGIDDFDKFLRYNNRYTFIIIGYNDKNALIELSRKKYLSNISLEYGLEYNGFKIPKKNIVYGNKIEGKLLYNRNKRISSSEIKVCLSSKNEIPEFHITKDLIY